LIIICRTNKGKVIGGYNSKTFGHEPLYGDWIGDLSQSSFLFSLSNNDKFLLMKKDNAVFYCRDGKFIRFGTL
jgi:hypothetical protein